MIKKIAGLMLIMPMVALSVLLIALHLMYIGEGMSLYRGLWTASVGHVIVGIIFLCTWSAFKGIELLTGRKI